MLKGSQCFIKLAPHPQCSFAQLPQCELHSHCDPLVQGQVGSPHRPEEGSTEYSSAPEHKLCVTGASALGTVMRQLTKGGVGVSG